MRKSPTTTAAVITAVLLIARPLRAQDDSRRDPQPPKLDAAVADGLSFLARAQAADGSIDAGGPNVATTALAVSAFLAAGHTPDVGGHGLTVRRAVDFLSRSAPADGYFGGIDASRMHGHAVATLALAEAAGVEPDAARRARLVTAVARAVDVIGAAQDVAKPAAHAGGWGAEPTSPDSDLLLTGWTLLALRAAGNAGAAVPQERFDRAAAYLVSRRAVGRDGFAPKQGDEPTPAMTGVAVLTLSLLGRGESPEVVAGMKYLTKHPPAPADRAAAFFAAHAAHLAGGDAWPALARPIVDHLLATQTPDGAWSSPAGAAADAHGRGYSTATAVLTLTAPYKLLPTYQR